MVYKLIKLTQVTFGISMLKNIFLLHTNMYIHDTCH